MGVSARNSSISLDCCCLGDPKLVSCVARFTLTPASGKKWSGENAGAQCVAWPWE